MKGASPKNAGIPKFEAACRAKKRNRLRAANARRAGKKQTTPVKGVQLRDLRKQVNFERHLQAVQKEKTMREQ